MAFDRTTCQPYHDALVWCDQRTKGIVSEMIESKGQNGFKQVTGLPISTYFSAFKMAWLIQNNPAIRDNLSQVSFGTMDSYLLNYLTGNF